MCLCGIADEEWVAKWLEECFLLCVCVYLRAHPLQLFSLLHSPTTRLLLMEEEEDIQHIIFHPIPLSPSSLPAICVPVSPYFLLLALLY